MVTVEVDIDCFEEDGSVELLRGLRQEEEING